MKKTNNLEHKISSISFNFGQPRRQKYAKSVVNIFLDPPCYHILKLA